MLNGALAASAAHKKDSPVGYAGHADEYPRDPRNPCLLDENSFR